MLRANLSSRPFYNERLVWLGLSVAALALLALTAFNASRISTLSETRATQDREISYNRDEAARIRADAATLSNAVDRSRLRELAVRTSEANQLIAQRTFSWTQFFDIIEGALPFEVRLVGVAHRVESGERLLVLNVVAQQDADLNTFVRAMLETGAFFDVLPTEKAANDDGSISAIVETFYLPPATANGGRP